MRKLLVILILLASFAWPQQRTSGQSATPQLKITVPSGPISAPLKVSTANSRYFADSSGNTIALMGAHYDYLIQDDGTHNEPNCTTFISTLKRYGMNFTQFWAWWSKQDPFSEKYYNHTVYRVDRATGKFDTQHVSTAFLHQVESCVAKANANGIYVAVYLFNGISPGCSGAGCGTANAWNTFPYNPAYNINRVNGDPNSTGNGQQCYATLLPECSAILALERVYVDALIARLNKYPNVIWETCLECSYNYNGGESALSTWVSYWVNYIKDKERTLPYQHLVFWSASDAYDTSQVSHKTSLATMLASNANLASVDNSSHSYMSGQVPVNNNSKPLVVDTDHVGAGGCGGSPSRPNPLDCIFENVLRGHNFLLLNPWWYRQGAFQNIGPLMSYMKRIDLANSVPAGDTAVCGSGYCLYKAGTSYLMWMPTGSTTITVDLTPYHGTYEVELWNPLTRSKSTQSPISGGAVRTITPGFNPALVLIKAQ